MLHPCPPHTHTGYQRSSSLAWGVEKERQCSARHISEGFDSERLLCSLESGDCRVQRPPFKQWSYCVILVFMSPLGWHGHTLLIPQSLLSSPGLHCHGVSRSVYWMSIYSRQDLPRHSFLAWDAVWASAKPGLVQWLRLQAPYAGGLGSIPGQGTRSHMPQLKILCPTTKIRCRQIKNVKKKSIIIKQQERRLRWD